MTNGDKVPLAVCCGAIVSLTILVGTKALWPVVGFVAAFVPCLRTLKALREKNEDHTRSWISYWILFSVCCSIIDKILRHKFRSKTWYSAVVLVLALALSSRNAALSGRAWALLSQQRYNPWLANASASSSNVDPASAQAE
mmetsp:Transcript_12330/g.50708  ORF Transcript_12330/g.50708 Transcript_12330/m.50708 type:complete len:141 (-) Transcript_12330:190-612(-)|eukprot:CAMPEP_0113956398 /NCGR_PEP_ID=MMETSP0011_2-20120614/2040_1 /TAXON_ID=101924 /ORGANISM="Rhodosorus marinus" /LENGTH=140 /DNA_ID=CAMNT_0000966541 /DNA_START=125 /DNA_END=547 /DNA_ORIENTATION=- /assembly_acc=CAM_ASM_000156